MTTANLTGTLTVTRHERGVLRHIVALAIDGDTISLDSRDTAAEALARREQFERCFAILDQLGWERDEPGDTFELTTDANFRRVLTDELKGAKEHVAETALSWKQCQDREDGILNPGETWEEVTPRAKAQLDRALDELAALSRVSQRLWWKDRGEDRDV
jgi:hypothetical protein